MPVANTTNYTPTGLVYAMGLDAQGNVHMQVVNKTTVGPPLSSADYVGQICVDPQAFRLYVAATVGNGASDWFDVAGQTNVQQISGVMDWTDTNETGLLTFMGVA